MRTLAASDLSILTRLASSLPTGSSERRTILAGLAKQAIEFTSDEQMQKYLKDHPKADPKKHSVKEKGGKGEGKSREIKSADGKDPHHVMGAAGGNKVFMGNYTVKHLQTHAQPGKGSVFSGKIKPEDISAAINKIPAKFFEEGGGAFEIDVPNAGSDLVQKSSDILKKYPNAKKITVPKQEGVVMGEDGKPKMGEDGKPIPKMVDVTAYVVDDGEDAFSTNKMTVVLRPANPQFMPEEAKKDEELSGALNDKKGFAVLTAFPGKKDVPKASEWGDEYAIIVPNGGKGADADVQKALGSSKKGFVTHHPQEFGSMRKLSSSNRSALIRLASGMPKGDPTRRAIIAGLRTAGAFEEAVKGKKFKNPETGNDVVFGSLPADEQKKIRSQWEEKGGGKKSVIRKLKDYLFGNAEVLDNAKVFDKAKVSDNATVSGEARVYEYAKVSDNAKVSGKAQIYGKAEVRGKAQIYGNAEVLDNAKVFDKAKVYGNATVSDRASVYGNAKVSDRALVTANVYGNAQVYEDAKVYSDVKVYENAQVYGKAQIWGNAVVSGRARIGGDAIILGGEWDGSEGEVTSGKWKAPGVPA